MVCPSGAICFAIPRNHAQKRAWLPAQTTYRTQRRGRLYEPSVLYKYIAPMEQTRPVKDAIFVEKRRKPAPFAPAGDRKSTRLNSSHVAISYAVFCLKKKKKIE